MYFTVVDNILNEVNKRFNDNFDFLTAISVFNPTLNNFLNNNFVLKFMNYYDDDKYFLDKVLSQCRLAKNMYISCKNIMDFTKKYAI
jgi:hypothetical protein